MPPYSNIAENKWSGNTNDVNVRIDLQQSFRTGETLQIYIHLFSQDCEEQPQTSEQLNQGKYARAFLLKVKQIYH